MLLFTLRWLEWSGGWYLWWAPRSNLSSVLASWRCRSSPGLAGPPSRWGWGSWSCKLSKDTIIGNSAQCVKVILEVRRLQAIWEIGRRDVDDHKREKARTFLIGCKQLNGHVKSLHWHHLCMRIFVCAHFHSLAIKVDRRGIFFLCLFGDTLKRFKC